jgi:hypothetical protein
VEAVCFSCREKCVVSDPEVTGKKKLSDLTNKHITSCPAISVCCAIYNNEKEGERWSKTLYFPPMNRNGTGVLEKLVWLVP